jgi:hypothetical protein
MSSEKSSGYTSCTSSLAKQHTPSKSAIVLSSAALLGCLLLVIRLETAQHNNGLHFEDLEKDVKDLWKQKLNRGKNIRQSSLLDMS